MIEFAYTNEKHVITECMLLKVLINYDLQIIHNVKINICEEEISVMKD